MTCSGIGWWKRLEDGQKTLIVGDMWKDPSAKEGEGRLVTWLVHVKLGN